MSTNKPKISLRDRILYARSHLTHKNYINLLSEPSWRMKLAIKTKLYEPNKISRAAKRYRPTKRIKIMARPKTFTPKYESRIKSESTLQDEETNVYTPSGRILELALPKKRVLMHTVKYAPSVTISNTAKELLETTFTTRYQEFRSIGNLVRQRISEKLPERKALAEGDWKRHIQALEKLAMPKKIHKRKKPKKKKWRPPNMRRIRRLAKPKEKKYIKPKISWEVPKSALNYQISARLNRLVYLKHKRITYSPKIPGVVSPAALSAIASKRIVELAQHIEHPPGKEIDIKENAFQVSPTALKARCSPRLRRLAKPKVQS